MMHSFADEFLLLSKEAGDDVSRTEALGALRRLRKLEHTKPEAGEIARGALAGGVAGTASSLARGVVSGSLRSGVAEAMKAPTARGKASKLVGGAAKGIGSSMAGSAAFGSTLPFVRRQLDRGAEKAKLRDYLGNSRGGKVRREVRKTLGV